MSRRIAIVEDDPDQRANYVDALSANGYEVAGYASRDDALGAFRRQLPDLAILDIMLNAEKDGGFDLCRDLRSMAPHLPIIFLTARDSDVDRVSGLRLDAWDYLTKPVSLEFLAVRINSLFRIAERLNHPAPNPQRITHENLVLDLDQMTAHWRGEALNLTLTEYWIVESLARHPGHVKSYDALMQVTRQTYVEKNSINTYIRRIRTKFREHDSEFERIQTVYGLGYRWGNGPH
ncbi:MAG: response regulator transcription factor [Gammaproteobacteria bacterium]|jgi:two-component system OmpR family response regulator|nr:response regulator transcription factor [Gammaproteobacteria bacterium]